VLGQHVTALRMKIERLKHGDARTLEQRVEDALRLVDRIDRDLDFFAWELRPASLGGRGLLSALTALAREWSELYGLAVQLEAKRLRSPRLAPAAENALYRVAQEALINVCKHAAARSATLRLELHGNRLVLAVQDAGRGFDLCARAGQQHAGIGLLAMRERTELAGGTLTIETAPGQGTAVIASVPLLPTSSLPRASSRPRAARRPPI
jgi:signal transduction histidine kinase